VATAISRNAKAAPEMGRLFLLLRDFEDGGLSPKIDTGIDYSLRPVVHKI